jgi:hypothetical protein
MTLLQVVTPETRLLVHLISEVEVSALHEFFPGGRLTDLLEHGNNNLFCEKVFGNGNNVTVKAQLGRRALAEVEVGCALLDEHLEVLINNGHEISVVGSYLVKVLN